MHKVEYFFETPSSAKTGNRRIMRHHQLCLIMHHFQSTKHMYRWIIPLLPALILENLIDELSDELKFSWHSLSGRIIHV